MERALGACTSCGEVVVVGILDGEVIPVGQNACGNCGGTEFVLSDDG